MFIHDRSKICIHWNMNRNLSIDQRERKRRGRRRRRRLTLRIETNLFVEEEYHELVTKGPNFSISIRILESPESKLSGPGLKGHVNGPIAGGKGSGRIRTAEFHLHPLAHERPYNGIIKWPVWSMAGRIRGKGDVVQIVKRLSGSLTHWFRYWNCYWFRIDRNALRGTHFDDYYYDNEFEERGKKKEKN